MILWQPGRPLPAPGISISIFQLARQPRPGEFPVPFERSHGDAHRFRRFLFAETAKEPQLNYLTRPWVQRFQPRQSLVDRDRTFVAVHSGAVRIAQRELDLAPAAFLAMRSPGMIHQNSAQLLGGHGEEMPAALPVDRLGSTQLYRPPLSRPFFARNKLMLDGVSGLSLGRPVRPPLAIPALESALGAHPCGALSSVQMPPV